MTDLNSNPVIDRYDLSTAMHPLWEGDTVYNESVMFLGKNDVARLTFEPEKVLSVRSQDLKTEYEEGRDYIFRDGKITLTGDTRITFIPEELYYSHNKESDIVLEAMKDGERREIFYSESIWKYQVFVTYTHTKDRVLFIPPDESASFTRLRGKFERGEDVTLFFFGDSITHGASTSGFFKSEPFTPIYPVMVADNLAKKYGYTVNYIESGLTGTPPLPKAPAVFGDRGTLTFINTAVGGWQIIHAIDCYDTYIRPFIDKYGCDFFLLAFGMNDGFRTADEERNLYSKAIDLIYAQKPDVELLLVSTMLPNNDIVNGWFANQGLFEPVLYELSEKYRSLGRSIAVAPVTSMSRRLLETKRFRDYTGNNVNHPNDFMARVYAQVVFRAIEGGN